MKKFLVMATVVGAAFTSCVDDNEAVWQQEESSARPITFEVAKYKPASRAEGEPAQQADDGIVKFETDKTFGTFAYELAYGKQAHEIFMDNVQIKHYSVDGSVGYWAAAPVTTSDDEGVSTTNTPKYTWPTNAHLDFISYYPYSSDKAASCVPQISDDNIQGTFEYKGFVVDADNPVDLMYSDKAVYQTANTQHYGFVGVPTLFRHALAKLNFLVKAQKLNNHKDAVSDAHKLEWEITLNEISINNIFKKGSLKMNVSGTESETATTVQWVNDFLTDANTENNADVWDVDRSQGVDMAAKTWTQNQVLTTTATSYAVRATAEQGGGIISETKDYFVMPQLLKGTQTITIKYTVKTIDGSSESSETFEKTLKFNEVSTTVTAWERGKNITYTIEIDPEGDIINFAPAVVDWESQNGTISI